MIICCVSLEGTVLCETGYLSTFYYPLYTKNKKCEGVYGCKFYRAIDERLPPPNAWIRRHVSAVVSSGLPVFRARYGQVPEVMIFPSRTTPVPAYVPSANTPCSNAYRFFFNTPARCNTTTDPCWAAMGILRAAALRTISMSSSGIGAINPTAKDGRSTPVKSTSRTSASFKSGLIIALPLPSVLPDTEAASTANPAASSIRSITPTSRLSMNCRSLDPSRSTSNTFGLLPVPAVAVVEPLGSPPHIAPFQRVPRFTQARNRRLLLGYV
jgi:hypothetical protein